MSLGIISGLVLKNLFMFIFSDKDKPISLLVFLFMHADALWHVLVNKIWFSGYFRHLDYCHVYV